MIQKFVSLPIIRIRIKNFKKSYFATKSLYSSLYSYMKHASALGRCYEVFVISENSFEPNLAMKQYSDLLKNYV